MKIYTSYFGQLKHLKENNIIPIAICRYIPKYYNGLVYQKVAPSEDILNTCRGSHIEYKQRFYNEILFKLDPIEVIKDIVELSGNKDCALLCYEIPSEFCHRHIVKEWLSKSLNINNIEEYQYSNKLKTTPLF